MTVRAILKSIVLIAAIITTGCSTMIQPPVDTYIEDLSPPENVSISQGEYQDKIVISWETDQPHYTYYIYRSENRDGPYSPIVEKTSTKFHTDRNLQPGTSFWYKISTADAEGTNEGEQSLPFKGSTRSYSRDEIVQEGLTRLRVNEALREFRIEAGEERWFSAEVDPQSSYTIMWDDRDNMHQYTADIQISAVNEDLDTLFFSNVNTGGDSFTFTKTIQSGENDRRIYIKVNEQRSSEGTFGIRIAGSEIFAAEKADEGITEDSLPRGDEIEGPESSELSAADSGPQEPSELPDSDAAAEKAGPETGSDEAQKSSPEKTAEEASELLDEPDRDIEAELDSEPEKTSDSAQTDMETSIKSEAEDGETDESRAEAEPILDAAEDEQVMEALPGDTDGDARETAQPDASLSDSADDTEKASASEAAQPKISEADGTAGFSFSTLSDPIYGGRVSVYPPIHADIMASASAANSAHSSIQLIPKPTNGFLFSSWTGRSADRIFYIGNGKYRMEINPDGRNELTLNFEAGPLKKPARKPLQEGNFFISSIDAGPRTIWTTYYNQEDDTLSSLISSDQGDSWSSPKFIDTVGYYSSETLFDTATDGEYLYMAYNVERTQNDHSLNFIKINKSGVPVSKQTLFQPPQMYTPVSITIDGDNIFVLTFDIQTQRIDHSGSVLLFHSPDGGRSWKTPIPLLTIGRQIDSIDTNNIVSTVDGCGNLIFAVSRIRLNSLYQTRLYSYRYAEELIPADAEAPEIRSRKIGDLTEITPELDSYKGEEAGKGISLTAFNGAIWFVYTDEEAHGYDIMRKTCDANWAHLDSVPVNEATQMLRIPELLITHDAAVLAYSEEILDPPSINPIFTLAISRDGGQNFSEIHKLSERGKAFTRFGLAWDGNYLYAVHVNQDRLNTQREIKFYRSVKGKSWE